jgi:hypothetical protein
MPTAGTSELSDSVRWTVHDALRAEVEALGREIALCLRYCSVTFRGLRPHSAVVVGGQAYDPAIVKLLGSQLNVECTVGQPLQGLDISHAGFDGRRRGALAEWAVAGGMAIRDAGESRKREDSYVEHRLSA